MTEISYQLILLGNPDKFESAIKDVLAQRLEDLGLTPDTVSVTGEEIIDGRNRRLPTVGVYFGHPGAKVTPGLKALLDESIVIVPIVSDLKAVSAETPKELHGINALPVSDEVVGRVVSLVLETFRLLRTTRRLFISYKRDDSQAVANQLYDALDARGFDVFIDTRSVPPAADFQSELWHRLTDSDLVVLLDTPGFRESRWTTEELSKANATSVQILHILWPGQSEDPASSFSRFIPLEDASFASDDQSKSGTLSDLTVVNICSEAEHLRARAIAVRHRNLLDNFCDAARDIGLAPAVQPERWIVLPIKNGDEIVVVPAVGVPTSDRINLIFDAVRSGRVTAEQIWVLYDNRGVLESWVKHIEWLDAHLPIRSLQSSRIAKALEEIR